MVTEIEFKDGIKNPDADVRISVGGQYLHIKRSELFKFSDAVVGYIETGIDRVFINSTAKGSKPDAPQD